MQRFVLLRPAVVLVGLLLVLTGCGGPKAGDVGRVHIENESGEAPYFWSPFEYQDACLAYKEFKEGKIPKIELMERMKPYVLVRDTIKNGTWVRILDEATVKCSIPGTAWGSRLYQVEETETGQKCWICSNWFSPASKSEYAKWKEEEILRQQAADREMVERKRQANVELIDWAWRSAHVGKSDYGTPVWEIYIVATLRSDKSFGPEHQPWDLSGTRVHLKLACQYPWQDASTGYKIADWKIGVINNMTKDESVTLSWTVNNFPTYAFLREPSTLCRFEMLTNTETYILAYEEDNWVRTAWSSAVK